MSVGGRLLEITRHRFDDGKEVLRLWVIAMNAGGPGVHDEVCVYAEPQESLPQIGDGVWWQSGEIYFDNDRQHLKKVGYSFSAPSA